MTEEGHQLTIEIRNLKKVYRKRLWSQALAVEDLDLSIQKGEVFGFLGPNGAGKSTVIKILMNFIRPTSGSTMINGFPVSSPSVRKVVGYLPENPYFYDHLTAEEILMFGGRAAQMDKSDIYERMEYLLTRLKMLHAKKQALRTYSKGMLQRIGLALSLIHNPELCILDEPMSGLDPLGRRLVADLVLDMRNSGKTVFFSSHILSDIEKLCDRIGIMNRGRLLLLGGVKDFSTEAGSFEESFIRLIEVDERENYGADLAIG